MYYYAKAHKGSKRLFLQFPYSNEIVNKLKTIAPCLWSRTEKAWHFEASNSIFQKLKEAYPQLEATTIVADKEYIVKKAREENPAPKHLTVRAIPARLRHSGGHYKDGRYKIIAFYNPLLIAILKNFPYAKYDKAKKWWTAAIDVKQKKALEDFCKTQNLLLQWEDEQKKQTLKPRPQAFEIANYRTCPDEMMQKLETMRYSPQTIAAYKQLLEEFINPNYALERIAPTFMSGNKLTKPNGL